MPLLEEVALLGVGYRFETIVGAELLVDVVEVVAERLGGNPQLPGDGRGVVASGEQLEDAPLMYGERLDGGVVGLIGERNDSPRGLHHAAGQLLVAPPLIDVARQPHQQPASRLSVVEQDRRDVHLDPVPGSGAHFQIEIGDPAGRFTAMAGRRFGASSERLGVQRVMRPEHVVDVPAEHLVGAG
jgi:hypothetical protein